MNEKNSSVPMSLLDLSLILKLFLNVLRGGEGGKKIHMNFIHTVFCFLLRQLSLLSTANKNCRYLAWY